jgi:plasmid stabilization system protein ParE
MCVRALRGRMVVEIKYSPAAAVDLDGIYDHIASNLNSPVAALNTVNKIQTAIDRLVDFPLLGTSLSTIVETETNYRFLVSGNYLAFYRPVGDTVFIDRILYGRRDYLSILFGDLPLDGVE